MIKYSFIEDQIFSIICEPQPDPELAISFGKKLCNLRSVQNISQQELAQRARSAS